MKTNYQQQAKDMLSKLNVTFKSEFSRFDYHFQDDKQKRNIFNITLSNNKGSYSFEFGSSLQDSLSNVKDVNIEEPIEFYYVLKFEGLKYEYLSYSDTFKLAQVKKHMGEGKNPKYLIDKNKAKKIHAEFITSNSSRYLRPNILTVEEWIDRIECAIIKKCSEISAKNFGEGIQAKEIMHPTEYGVIACMQKYPVGSFEDFCGDFGYDEDSRKAEKIYETVKAEYEALERLFTTEELEQLQEIQ